MTKIPISIAIPALNEEMNIANLITSLLEQDDSNYDLVEIIVVSDGSIDKTVDIVNNFLAKNVRVVDYKERNGKSARLNNILHEIIDWNRSEAVVLFDADVLPLNNSVLERMVQPFIDDKNITLVSGNPKQVKPRNFFEKILQVSAFLQEDIKRTLPKSVYTCHGRVIAVGKKIAMKINGPSKDMAGDDAFLFFSNKKHGTGYAFASNSNVFFRMPGNFLDYFKQFKRFNKAKLRLIDFFGNDIMAEFNVPTYVRARSICRSFVRYPFYAPIYYLIYVYSFFLTVFSKEKYQGSGWEISTSTKDL